MAILKRKTGKSTSTKTESTPKSAFGGVWKKASKAASVGLPVGVHEAFLTAAGQHEDETDRVAFWLQFTVVNDDKLNGRTGRIYYNVADEDGDAQPGADFLKRDLARLGFDTEVDEIESEEEMNSLLEEVVAKKIWVILEVKCKGQYTNTYLQDVPDPEEGDMPDYPEQE